MFRPTNDERVVATWYERIKDDISEYSTEEKLSCVKSLISIPKKLVQQLEGQSILMFD